MEKVYAYDANGYFSGETEAQVSPLDGVILMPPNTTQLKPPTAAGMIANFSGTGWSLLKNWAGTTYWLEDGTECVHQEHHELPGGALSEKPIIPIPPRTADDINQERKAMIDAGCYVNGVLFDADSNAQIAYMGFEKALQFDPTYSTSWKASAGVWVTMNATLYAQVVPVILAHVAACFAWQKEQEQLLSGE